MNYPKTRKENIVDEIHGHKVEDPYRWLESISNPEVQNWINAQNDLTHSTLNQFPGRKKLVEEFSRLFREDTIGFPHPINGLYFFRERKANEDQSVLYVQEGLNGTPRVLIDPNTLSKDSGFVINLSDYSVSKDGSLITYTLSEAANDKCDLFVMDVRTGKNLPDMVPGHLYPATGSWTIDNSGFYYTRRSEGTPDGEEKFHQKIYYHTLGTTHLEDRLIYGEHLAKEDRPGAGVTRDGRYMLIHVRIMSEKVRRSEIFLYDFQKTEKGFIPIVKDIRTDEETYFSARIHRDHVYILNNHNAPKDKINRVKIDQVEQGLSAWELLLPENTNRTIESYSLTGDRLFIGFLENAYSRLEEYSLSGTFVRSIDLPTLGSASRIIAEPEGEEAFFSFSSFAFPNTIFRIDFKTNITSIFKQRKISFDPSTIESRQEWFISKDGTRVPLFLVYQKGLSISQNTPALLYGYGGFGASITPSFGSGIIPFLEKGGLYVVANLRGGGEFGREWHQAGTRKQKQNTFDDFIAAAEWLVNNQYTNPSRLAIWGGSNGGLLVGAVMTQRPDLFKAVIMGAPVADMLRYHLFHGGRLWIPDYGSAEDPEMVPYLLKYSPYHNIHAGITYPATLIITADQDDRVHPGQAFKVAACLQKSNTNPILIRIERQAGHSGAADLTSTIERAADEWSFIFGQLGM